MIIDNKKSFQKVSNNINNPNSQIKKSKTKNKILIKSIPYPKNQNKIDIRSIKTLFEPKKELY